MLFWRGIVFFGTQDVIVESRPKFFIGKAYPIKRIRFSQFLIFLILLQFVHWVIYFTGHNITVHISVPQLPAVLAHDFQIRFLSSLPLSCSHSHARAESQSKAHSNRLGATKTEQHHEHKIHEYQSLSVVPTVDGSKHLPSVHNTWPRRRSSARIGGNYSYMSPRAPTPFTTPGKQILCFGTLDCLQRIWKQIITILISPAKGPC